MNELKSLINDFDIRLSEGEVRDVVDWSDVEDAASTVAKKVHGKVDKKALKNIIANAKKHKPDSTAAAIEMVKNMLQESTHFNFGSEDEMARDKMEPEGPEDELGLDTGDASEFDTEYDEPEHERDRGEIDMSMRGEEGEDGEEDMFAGEKRVDITNKLKAMLQGRDMGDETGEPDDEAQLPSLDDLDLDSDEDESDRGSDDEDPDFDYDAFSDEREPSKENDDENVEFDFNIYK